jgi:hypothetical protein
MQLAFVKMIQVTEYTIKVLTIAKRSQLDSLHMQACRLQTVPQCGRGDTALVIEATDIMDPIAIL